MAGYQAPENNVELAAGGGGGKQSLSLMWVGGWVVKHGIGMALLHVS